MMTDHDSRTADAPGTPPSQPQVSIIIPHYQTDSLVRLCLRSIKRYTTDVPYEVIVVDNGSTDGASLDYLRHVKWIRLIERSEGVSSVPPDAHKEALDAGIEASHAPYFMSFHTDTIPIATGWCRWMLDQMPPTSRIAAVGTYKLERKPLKDLEHWLKNLLRKGEIPADERLYIRSHCALYRRDIFDKLGLNFISEADRTTGQGVHMSIENAGYKAVLLSISQMLKQVVHLNHGTMVMIPALGARKSTIRKGKGRIERFFQRKDVIETYHDASLDM